MKTEDDIHVHHGELVDEEIDNQLELRRPSVPVSVLELAALEGTRGLEIVKARLQIIESLTVASLKLTVPTDWVLFKVPGTGQIYGYLQDQGCDRIKKLWGIQIGNLSEMKEVTDSDAPGEYAYKITGDGRCNTTGESVFNMEGIRYSTEDYAQQKPKGLQRKIAVQKAARANLDGSITRELSGMKGVPVEDLTKAWTDTWKKIEMCHKGRGFGTGSERLGGASEATGLDQADIPECDVCRIPLLWRNGKDGKEGFFGCKNWDKHKESKVIVSMDQAKEMAARKKAAREAAEEKK